MDRVYIDRLNQAYEAYFSLPLGVPILALDTNHLDFVRNPSDLDYIAGRIRDGLHLPPYQPALPLSGESTA
jgi:deoxyadenosine/deoxycytidine kinase